MAKYVGAQPRVSGNRIDGGTITTFASTGIDDNATATKVAVTDAATTFTGNILPEADSTRNLGATGTRFLNLFVDDVTATTSVTVPTINVGTALLPDANDGADLGSTSKGFSDLYLADGAVIKFGNDQDVTLTHNPDVGLTLNTKLTVTGVTQLNDNVTVDTSEISLEDNAPRLKIKDKNGNDTTSDLFVKFEKSTGGHIGSVGMSGGKTVISNNVTGADGGFSIVEGTNSSFADSFYIDMKKNAAASTVVNAQTNIAFSNSGTITGGGSSFSSVSAGEVIEVSGAGQAANNKEFRVISKAADVLTVRSADGTALATESAGATVTITKGNQRVITVPNTVDMNVFTAEQTDNTQRVASTAYVRTAISNMLDSSPAALDTLNELAAAINDDANFATTINNSIATKVNRDFDNLTATGTEALNDAIGAFGGGTMTFPGTGNSIALTHDDANNQFDVTVALNDPTLGVTLTGAVTGTGTATMTDLQDTTITFATTLASGAVGAAALDTTGAVTNIVNGLTRTTTVQNSDDVIISDASDGGALKKLARSLIAPPALGEDLGFFAIAMS